MKSVKLQHILFIIFSVGLASSISLIGGLGIEAVQNELIYIVPLLIALPAMNSLVGDYATLIAAHAGDPTERSLSKIQLAKAMAPSVLTSTTLILSVSLLVSIHRGFNLSNVFFIKYLLFVSASILFVIAMMFTLTTLLDKILENKNINPDDVLIPIVTTISDIFMLGLIALAVRFYF